MKNAQLLLLSIIGSILMFSCSDDTDDMVIDPNEGLIETASVSVPDSEYTLKMFIPEGQTLEVGYNKFALGLFDGDGMYMKNVHLTSIPMMQMMEMAHSAPNETYEHEMGGEMYQHFATVFVMPSGEMGAWNLKVSIHDMDTDFSSEVQIPVTVHSPEQAKMNAISVDENSSLFISLVSPELPSVGVNDFEITIHERESMMVWPAMTNYTIEIEPEMPAMGHGSPNNVNPVHESMGHYIGEVNFTMTGEWLVHVTIKDGTDVVADTHFTIIF